MLYSICMNISPTLVPQDEDLLHLTLPDLLPEHAFLAVHPHLHMVSLLYTETGEPRIQVQVHFTANGMRVLVPLLQSYPYYCPYAFLASHLCPSLPLEQCHQMIQHSHTPDYELVMRPLRRTVSGLSDGLHHLGVEVCSIRTTGYFLKQHSPLLH